MCLFKVAVSHGIKMIGNKENKEKYGRHPLQVQLEKSFEIDNL